MAGGGKQEILAYIIREGKEEGNTKAQAKKKGGTRKAGGYCLRNS